MISRRKIPSWLPNGAAVLFLTLVFWFVWNQTPSPHVEPDRFYHLAVSRWMAETGWAPRSFPPAEDIGWDVDFPERYWLYHLLTTLAWKLGGADGVSHFTAGVGALLLAALYGVLRLLVGFWPSLLLTVGAFAAAPLPMIRAPAMRPANLALLLLLLLVAALLRRRPWLALLAAMAGALAYHAMYLPLLVILGFVAARRIASGGSEPSPPGPRPEIFAFLGLAAGVLANPYFPHPVVQGVMMALVGAHAPGLPQNLPLGQELRPWPLPFLLQNLAPGLVLMGVSAFVAIRGFGKNRDFLSVATGLPALLFLTMALRQARAVDFFLPAAAIFTAAALRHRPRAAAALGAAALLLQSPNLLDYARELRTGEGGLAALIYSDRSFQAAARSLPPEAQGGKVFNCNWTTGAHLSWYQPKMRFVDLLDPTHLWFAHPGKYRAKEAITAGLSPRPVEAIREIFRAQYVLCDGQPLNGQLKALGLKPLYSDRFGTEVFALP